MAHIDKRKIIKIGKSSYGVIIPISWIRYYGLIRGDEVEIISNGSIKIKPLNIANKQIGLTNYFFENNNTINKLNLKKSWED